MPTACLHSYTEACETMHDLSYGGFRFVDAHESRGRVNRAISAQIRQPTQVVAQACAALAPSICRKTKVGWAEKMFVFQVRSNTNKVPKSLNQCCAGAAF